MTGPWPIDVVPQPIIAAVPPIALAFASVFALALVVALVRAFPASKLRPAMSRRCMGFESAMGTSEDNMLYPILKQSVYGEVWLVGLLLCSTKNLRMNGNGLRNSACIDLIQKCYQAYVIYSF